LLGVDEGVASDNPTLEGGGSIATNYGCPDEEIDGREEQTREGGSRVDDGRDGSEDRPEVLERGDDAVGDGGEAGMADTRGSACGGLAIDRGEVGGRADAGGEGAVRVADGGASDEVCAGAVADVSAARREMAGDVRAGAGDLFRAGAPARRGDADGLHMGD